MAEMYCNWPAHRDEPKCVKWRLEKERDAARAEATQLRVLLNDAADALAAYHDDESYAEEGIIARIEEVLHG